MLFNSWGFVAFFLVVLPVYYGLSHRWQNRFLLVASYVFYGAWDWRFTGLLATSTIVDFFAARGMDGDASDKRKRLCLGFSLATNLGILGFFKYFDFFAESAADLLGRFGLNASPILLNVVLPVGISFYTFQTLAYTIDVYRGKQRPTRDFVSFAVYVAYFPQLVAGPIERASRLLPQITRPRRVSQEQWASGAQLILWGYLKKVVIADSLAPYVEAAFRDPANMHGLDLWLALYCFALQIYCDFAGYSLIARGVSRLFGIELMQNFRQPYFSRNITEFWRRWHISLSSWLRDYVYIPLGGNRKGVSKQYRNLMLTMLLGGLWHGAGWTFVVWGGLHGLYLAVHKAMTGDRKVGLEPAPTAPRGWLSFLAKAFLTFHLVCLSWVFFRADNMPAAIEYAGGLVLPLLTFGAGLTETMLPGGWLTLAFCAALVFLLDARCWFRDSESPLPARAPWWVRGAAYGLALVILAFVREASGEAFIYFQF